MATRCQVGSGVANRARAALAAETGFRSSAGIAHNKLLAKLVSGLHKPDDQTALAAADAAAFLTPLPVSVLQCRQCGTVQYSADQYSTMWYSSVQCGTVWYSAVHRRTAQYSKGQCSI